MITAYRVKRQRDLPPAHQHLLRDEEIVLEGWRQLDKEGLKVRRT